MGMSHEPTDSDLMANYLLRQIHMFIEIGGYEEFATAEALSALEIVKMELFAGALKEMGYHRWENGIDHATAMKLARPEPTIEDADVEEADIDDLPEITFDEDEDCDDTEDLGDL